MVAAVEIADVAEVVGSEEDLVMMEVEEVVVVVVSEVDVVEVMEVEMVVMEVDEEEEVVEAVMEVDVVVIEAVMVDAEAMVEEVMANSREEITTVKVVMEAVLEVDTVVLHLPHPRTELLQPNLRTTRTEAPQVPQPINHSHLVDMDSSNRVTTALVVNKATARVNNKAMARVNNRVTVAHHSNQQLQHLQVILKDTVNSNHTEQAQEDRTDISNLGPLTFVP